MRFLLVMFGFFDLACKGLEPVDHKCRAYLMRCIDNRLNSGFAEIVKLIGLKPKDYDLGSFTGSGKCLLAPWWLAWSRWFVLFEIWQSYKLHRIKEIIVLLHDDCGAYGITDVDEENHSQHYDLQLMRCLLKKTFPIIKFRSGIITGTASGELKLFMNE
ncbi:MAG: hypothetical protein WC508_04550 [Patescibacteria group bacterium]